jgi:hypothetical protein
MVYKDLVYSEIENQLKEKNKKRYDYVFLWLIVLLIMLFFCFFCVKKPYEYIPDINDLPEPVQTDAT